jgi:UTP--glucose-1-phosphate uridylyltransferase
MIKKVVIPAAGLGSRLLPITKEIPKEMMPIFLKSKSDEIIVKPLIQALFERFFNLGIKEYCFIVGRQKRAIEDHFTLDQELLQSIKSKNHLRKDLEQFYDMLKKTKVFWINQQKPSGFGDAVQYAESFVGNEEFLVSAGDTLIPESQNVMKRLMKTKLEGKNDALIILKEVTDPKRFGVAVVSNTKTGLLVKNVEEKPAKPKSNLSIVALYRFKPSIFTALTEVKHGNDELQLTDAIQRLIDRGGKIRAILMNKNDKVIDVGTAESYLDTFRL